MNGLVFLALTFVFASQCSAFSNTFWFAQPALDSTVPSPAFVELTSAGATPTQIILWVNGVQMRSARNASWINAHLTLAPGTHHLQATALYPGGAQLWADGYITVPGDLSVADQIYADMSGNNEAHPHGVPRSYDFSTGPIVGVSTDVVPNTALVWWAGLYVGPNGNPAINTQVAVKNAQLWILSKRTHQWTGVLAPTSTFDGGYYSEDWTVDYGQPVLPLTLLPDGSRAIITYHGEVAHIFAPWPRIAIDNTDIAGVVALAEAKLALIDPAGVDDRASASFLFTVGADPYPAIYGPGIENNVSVAAGKFKYVTGDWRSFAMTTMTQAEIETYPPPIDLTGILP